MFKGAVHHRASNFEHQVRPAWRPTHLLLGIHPAIGSFFSAENAVAGQDLVVVLSYGYWRQRFAGNPGVLGQSLPEA